MSISMFISFYIYIYIYVYIYIHRFIFVHARICMHNDIYIYICVCVCAFPLCTCHHVVSNALPCTNKTLHKGLIPLSLAVLHHTIDVFPASWTEQWQREENNQDLQFVATWNWFKEMAFLSVKVIRWCSVTYVWQRQSLTNLGAKHQCWEGTSTSPAWPSSSPRCTTLCACGGWTCWSFPWFWQWHWQTRPAKTVTLTRPGKDRCIRIWKGKIDVWAQFPQKHPRTAMWYAYLHLYMIYIYICIMEANRIQ